MAGASMLMLWLLLAASPALAGSADNCPGCAGGLSLSLEDNRLSLADRANHAVGTVRAPRIVDAVLVDDRSLLLLTASADGAASFLHLSLAASRRQERHGQVVTDGFLHIRSHRELDGLSPWKVRLADVDGDGAQELILGVRKRARFDPVMRRRLFVYAWPDWAPRWLGSRLSLPFEDFAFVDCDGDGKDDLLALELAADGRRRLMRYEWNGFGFTGEPGDFLVVTPSSDFVAVHANGFRLLTTSPRRLCPRKEPRR
jgi:hypothetical protein